MRASLVLACSLLVACSGKQAPAPPPSALVEGLGRAQWQALASRVQTCRTRWTVLQTRSPVPPGVAELGERIEEVAAEVAAGSKLRGADAIDRAEELRGSLRSLETEVRNLEAGR